MSVLWHNGELRPAGEPALRASDRALRGHGVFDTLLVIDGRLCHGDAHFERLKEHAALLGIETAHDFHDIAQTLLKANEARSGRFALNTVITGGTGARGLTAPDPLHPEVMMQISPAPDSLPAIEAVIAQSVRRNEGSPLSRIKSINYGDNILALNEASAQGGNEAIMMNNAGHIACASVGNVFILEGGVLYTPPLSDGAMAGIVRGVLIEQFGAQEKTLSPQDLQSAAGVYISNSLRGLAPVTSLNGAPHIAAQLEIPKDFHE
ncbi:MAG: aminotransferase class IV [Alphaproteobacteria bacterium]|nr:aminotransferase class IV [Alphaproteobacteria bacterium]